MKWPSRSRSRLDLKVPEAEGRCGAPQHLTSPFRALFRTSFRPPKAELEAEKGPRKSNWVEEQREEPEIESKTYFRKVLQ